VIAETAIGLSMIGGAMHGAFHRNSFIYGRVLGRLPPQGRKVALTFDDGPNPDTTPRILDTLQKCAVKATFFVLGRHVERWPALVDRMVREGHQVGNHGYFHIKLHLRSPGYVRRDLVLGMRAIEQAGGTTPEFFRAPHGFRSPWVSAIARSMGQRTIGWSVGVRDSDQPGVSEILDRTLSRTRPGSIILLHDGDGYNADADRSQTAAALPLIITGLRDRGYEFVTLPAR